MTMRRSKVSSSCERRRARRRRLQAVSTTDVDSGGPAKTAEENLNQLTRRESNPCGQKPRTINQLEDAFTRVRLPPPPPEPPIFPNESSDRLDSSPISVRILMML